MGNQKIAIMLNERQLMKSVTMTVLKSLVIAFTKPKSYLYKND
jgi:hypothetical protein